MSDDQTTVNTQRYTPLYTAGEMENAVRFYNGTT